MPAAAFPTSVTLRYPLSQSLAAPVDVAEFLDGTEQRYRAGEFLQAFNLTFQDIPIAGLADVRTFWATVKGAFDSGFTFTLNGTNYLDMALEADDLTEVESSPELVTMSVKMRQTVRHGAYADTHAAVFPPLYGAVVTQRPFTARPRWCTTRNDAPSGKRYAWSDWPNPRHAWNIEYPAITPTEMAAQLSFFVAMGGKLRGFSFTDPNTAVTYSHCRIDTDTLETRFVQAGQCALTIPVSEFFV